METICGSSKCNKKILTTDDGVVFYSGNWFCNISCQSIFLS
jgi:hypothetical protein